MLSFFKRKERMLLIEEPPQTLIESRLLGDTECNRTVPMQCLPLRERFSIVSDVLDEAKIHNIKCPFDVDDYALHTLSPQIQVLVNLARSFEPSEAYQDFLREVTAETIDSLSCDRYTLGAIHNWSRISDYERKQTLHSVHIHVREAANFVADAPELFDLTEIRFFNEGFKDGTIKNGFFQPTTPDCKFRHIGINEHPMAKFHYGPLAAGLVVHETIHDQEDQLAEIVAANPYGRFARFEEDAEIVQLRREFAATIPSELFPAYRRQWHEVLARRCERQVRNAVIDMTNDY